MNPPRLLKAPLGTQKLTGISIAAACLALIAGCGPSNQDLIDAGQALVPHDSALTGVSDIDGPAVLVGDYRAYVDFDDGGLAPEEVLAAVDRRAVDEGWVERYRCDLPGALKVGYSRDSIKVDVRVPKPMVHDDNSIRVQRLGDGNEWPPRDCSLA